MVVQVVCLMLVGQVQDVNIVGGVPAVPTAQEIANAIVGALNGSGGVGPNTGQWTMNGNGFNGVAPDKTESPEPVDGFGGADAERGKVLSPSTFGYDQQGALGSKTGFKSLFAQPEGQRGNPQFTFDVPFLVGNDVAKMKFDMSAMSAGYEYKGHSSTGVWLRQSGGMLPTVLLALRYGLAAVFGVACAVSFFKFIGRG